MSSFQGYFSFPSVVAIAAATVTLLWFLFSKRKIQATDNNTEPSPPAPDSSVSPGGGVYEVFLSFCGKDTRNGFTDFLYTDLVSASILTFRDDNELRVGQKISHELLKAIQESKISIPILSKNYASSKWCLLELQQMVECHENGGQMIYPIFYDVDPSDVRNQRGSYEKAFVELTKIFSEDTVQKWRDALRTVGELKGVELEKETNGRQGELVKLVVEKVVLGLKKNFTHLPENLVGMDKHTEKMMELLDVDSNDVHIVGILGMGGLGKTTIAKVIYNNLCEQFESQCFLADVREKSKRTNNGVVDLQKEVISTILNRRDDSFSEVNEGRIRLSNAIRRKRFLLVLDDVDEISQVKMLIGDLIGYKAQSRIILTTREKEVLDATELTYHHVIYRSYEPDLMDDHYALQLFSKYAFMRDTPMEGYQIHSKEVVSIAAGLPLVLVVLGSDFFSKKDQDLWEEKLRKLRKIPHDQVLEKLRISFDALKDDEKQIFLDIVCFFIGKDTTRASYMWEDSEFSPKLGITVLTSKSLIKVGDNNEFIVHDQLRDLGRQIVFEEGKIEPWKRSRLWNTKDALQTLETCQGTSSINANSVTALHLEFVSEIDNSLGASHFQNLPNLRYLQMANMGDVRGDFNNLLPNLRWFGYRPTLRGGLGFYFKRLQNPVTLDLKNLNMKNLVILDLQGSVLRDDWDGWHKLKIINNLKYLNLSSCKGIPGLLDLSNLTKLVEVHLASCYNLIVIQGLGNLPSLKKLDVSHNKKLIQIVGVHKLLSLEYLNLEGCTELKGLGDVSYSVSRDDLDGWSKLKNLKYLNLSSFEGIPALLDLSNLTKLVEVHLSGCRNLTVIQGLDKLQSLKRLDASSSNQLIQIEGVQKLISLEHLNLEGCKSLKGLGDLSNLKKLQVLRGAPGLDTTDFSNSKKLRKLEVRENNRIEINLYGLEALEELQFFSCPSIVILPDLSSSKRLNKLTISHCSKLIEIQGIAGLEMLDFLEISNCESLERLADLPNFGMLKYIKVCNCGILQKVEGLEVIESLDTLELSCCTSLQKLPDLRSLKNLRHLNVNFLENLTRIHGLGELISLERLGIYDCSSIEALPDLSACQKLKYIDVCGCEKLSEIIGLEELISLETLDISDCISIEALPDLSACQKLEVLYVCGCVKLSEILGLEELKSLTRLDVRGCEGLGHLPNLSNVKILQSPPH